MKKSLHQIGLETKTDKADYHNFCQFYDDNFNHLRDSKISLLEIGILKECSMKMWREYFEHASIHGIDINQIFPTTNNVIYHRVNADNYDELMNFSQSHVSWDLIIDDGGHTMRQQQNAIKALWPNLKSGGIFVMEDLHTSFMSKTRYNIEGVPTTFDFIKCLQNKQSFQSQFIDNETYQNILSEVNNVVIWWKEINEGKDVTRSGSITSLIFKK